MYNIKIEYRTGNSFGSEDTDDLIGASWNKLDKAKEALQAIKEHLEFYKKTNGYSKNNKEKLKEYGKRYWFYKKYPEGSLYVRDDNDNLLLIDCFWCGFFERIYSAEIVSGNNELKITFNP